MPHPVNSSIPRPAAAGLVVYALGTTVAFLALGAPGGDFEPTTIASYISSGHWPAAFGFAYLGALCSIGLVLFGRGVRTVLGGALGDVAWALSIAGCAASVVGAFVTSGLDVAMAEGGTAVQAGVSQPVVYMVTEIGNLIAVCGPAAFAGVIALMLAARGPMAAWARPVAAVAGVCGLAAPWFFTYFVFVLWAIVAGGAVLLARPARTGATLQESLV